MLQVFRAWLSDTSETVTFRPKRTCLADIANTLPADVARQGKPLTAKQLLTASPATAAMEGWEYCPELLQLFHDAIAHKPGDAQPVDNTVMQGGTGCLLQHWVLHCASAANGSAQSCCSCFMTPLPPSQMMHFVEGQMCLLRASTLGSEVECAATHP